MSEQTQTESATVAPAGTTTTSTAPASSAPAGRIPEADIAALRDSLVALNPNIVPELVRGATVGELTQSIEAARAAYDRIAGALAGSPNPAPASTPTPPETPPAVPAGAQNLIVAVDDLPPHEKIRRGLQQLAARRTA